MQYRKSQTETLILKKNNKKTKGKLESQFSVSSNNPIKINRMCQPTEKL